MEIPVVNNQMDNSENCSDPVEDFIRDVRQVNENKRKELEMDNKINVTIDAATISNLIGRLHSIYSNEKSSIQVLRELFQNNSNNLEIIDKGSYGPPHEPLHISCVTIKNIGSFIGKAKSKQESKQQAARTAIEYIVGLSSNPVNPTKKRKKNKSKKESSMPNLIEAEKIAKFDNSFPPNQQQQQPENDINLEQKFFLDAPMSKRIFEAAADKWSEVVTPNKINNLILKLINDEMGQDHFKTLDLWRFKEFASFILVNEMDQTMQVLSLGSGTKCLSSEHLSLNGDVVHDSHAEIIARRSLLYVFYEHLEALIKNNMQDKPEFILEPLDDNHKRFRLKKHLKLHLFITSPPCGDSRIFNFNENLKNNNVPKGSLRVKIEKGQGTVPMPLNYISTWDGLLISTQRCTFMSCSDKIALWNVVGVQGSLLSFFLEPIYIESVVISNLFRYEHLVRALHGRINKSIVTEKLQMNPSYKVNECKVGVYNNFSSIETINFIPSFSHNWYCRMEQNDDNLEILRSETGTNFFNDDLSRLCKKKMLERFLKLITTYPKICEDIFYENDKLKKPICQFKDKTYHHLKNSSIHYHAAKLAMFTTFRDSGLGTWVSAPIDIDLFLIEKSLPSNQEKCEVKTKKC